MRLLKNDTSFFWDDMEHHTFNNLKHALTHAPMLQPLYFIKDYFLYVVASLSTIGMVLVHTDENDQENVIYYVSKIQLDSEIHYSHVEKLAGHGHHGLEVPSLHFALYSHCLRGF